MGLHKNITEGDLHVPGFIDSSDPGAVGAGRLWIDTSGGTGNWVTKIRNDADDGWEEVSGSGGGGGATDYDDLTSYKDLVTLQKSGAGLPSHAGKEAAIYDGAGYQILGRTAVRHWLDPHPDAASFDETWEFSTTGDMTQGQLETAGWTFDNCTAVVANGLLVITVSGAAIPKASLAVSFSGDFDVIATPVPYFGYVPNTVSLTSFNFMGGIGVADYRAGVADVAHYGIAYVNSSGLPAFDRRINGSWTSLAGTSEADNAYATSQAVRVFRNSAAVEVTSAGITMLPGFRLVADDAAPNNSGFVSNASVNDSSTFNKLFLTGSVGTMNAGEKFAFANIRRFQ